MIDYKKVHLTFPVFNEEVQLENSILETLQFCEANQIRNFDICIADNGSYDRTESIGYKLQSQFTKVKYIRLNNRGIGAALKAAWSESQADYLGYMDIDLSTDLQHFKHVYDLIQQGQEYDLILGSRLKQGAKVQKRILLREITSRCFNIWLRLNLQVGFTDAMCGFKFIEKRFYDRLASHFELTDNWFFPAELAIRAERIGAEILDIPVHWSDNLNSKSSDQLLYLILHYLASIERMRREKEG
jgi:glycosyltransferase involved in cell wall biosynthesis